MVIQLCNNKNKQGKIGCNFLADFQSLLNLTKLRKKSLTAKIICNQGLRFTDCVRLNFYLSGNHSNLMLIYRLGFFFMSTKSESRLEVTLLRLS